MTPAAETSATTHNTKKQWLPLVALSLLGALLITFTALWLKMWDHQRVTYYFWLFNIQALAYLAACFIVIKTESNRYALIIVLVVAATLRMMLLPTEPAHSTDIFRYVWEGYVQTHGINPFRYVPAAPELEHLRDDYIYVNINRKDYAKTPNPPVAQIIFAISNLIRPRGVTTLKIIWVLFEGVTIGALLGLLKKLNMNLSRVIVYAWSPLAIWEVAQNGHLDVAAATFITLAGLAAAHGKRATSGAMLAMATMVKLFPALLVAAFWKKGDKRLPIAMAVTLAIFYAPYLGVGTGILGFVTHYPAEEGFISGERFLLLKWIRLIIPLPPLVYLGIFAALLGTAGLYLLLKNKDIFQQLRGCTLLAGLVLFFISPQYGWYYLWLLPFLTLTIEPIAVSQVIATISVAAGFVRYHLAQTLTVDLLIAPVSIGFSLKQYPSIQWLWLLLVASAAWLSWI